MSDSDFEKLLEAKDSLIHGMGVFTTVDIPADAIIMRIVGDVIGEEECIRREEEENNVYIFWNGESYIDTVKTQVIKYINHDCESNCYIEDGDHESLLLCASRDIDINEELTIDYGYDEIYDMCSCIVCNPDGTIKKKHTD